MATNNPDPSNGNATVSLKDDTRWPLLFVFLLNVALFYLSVKTGTLVMGGVEKLIAGWRDLAPAGASFVFTSVFNELLDSDAKARLVFWRWRYPLPGHEAFTKHAQRDVRVDVSALESKYRPLPVAPREQNVLWYRLYKSVAGDPAVTQVHRKYLFTRDYAVLSFILLIVLGSSGHWMIPSRTTAGIYLAILAIQYLLVRQAAKNHGIRLVTTVLAIKATE